MDTERWQAICRAMEAAERRAAELMRQAHEILAETKSGRRDVVTEYDRRVQRQLEQELRAAVPEARFFCEELDEHEGLDGAAFIIDPIDGTMNFVRGFHHSCISVAYAERGRVCAGAIYNPYVDELFSAVLGCGAFLNGRPIHAAEGDLSDSVVCFGTAPYDAELAEETFRLARRLFDRSLDLRREGAAALDLCSVAAGRAGLYFELRLSLWDYAAGLLLVQEAGGRICSTEGEPLPLDGRRCGVAAGSAAAVEEFLRLRREE